MKPKKISVRKKYSIIRLAARRLGFQEPHMKEVLRGIAAQQSTPEAVAYNKVWGSLDSEDGWWHAVIQYFNTGAGA